MDSLVPGKPEVAGGKRSSRIKYLCGCRRVPPPLLILSNNPSISKYINSSLHTGKKRAKKKIGKSPKEKRKSSLIITELINQLSLPPLPKLPFPLLQRVTSFSSSLAPLSLSVKSKQVSPEYQYSLRNSEILSDTLKCNKKQKRRRQKRKKEKRRVFAKKRRNLIKILSDQSSKNQNHGRSYWLKQKQRAIFLLFRIII